MRVLVSSSFCGVKYFFKGCELLAEWVSPHEHGNKTFEHHLYSVIHFLKPVQLQSCLGTALNVLQREMLNTR
jgi:hypothetical protein